MAAVDVPAAIKGRNGTLKVTSSELCWSASSQTEVEIRVPLTVLSAPKVNKAGNDRVLLQVAITNRSAPNVVLPEGVNDLTILFTSKESAPSHRDSVLALFRLAVRHPTTTSFIGARLVLTHRLQRAPPGTPTPTPPSSQSNMASPMPSRLQGSSSPAPSSPSTPVSSQGMSANLPTTLRIRSQILKTNKEARHAHVNLVGSKLLTEEEFWSARQDLIVEEEMRLAYSVPNAMLADVRMAKSTGTGSEQIFTFTPTIIQSIFVQYPGVKRAYTDNVPERMTEEEFWAKFVQSEFFYRDRTNASAKSSMNGEPDMFDTYDRQYQEEESAKKRVRVNYDTLVDLTASEEDHFEGYGNRPDTTMRGGHTASTAVIAQRLHRHAAIALRGESNEPGQPEDPAARKAVVERATVLDDLTKPTAPDVVALEIPDYSLYTNSQVPSSESDGVNGKEVDPAAMVNALRKWQPRPYLPKLSAESAAKVSDYMSTTLTFKRERAAIEAAPLSEETSRQILTYGKTATQLLRHFWSCIRRPEMITKEIRLADSLRAFSQTIRTFGQNLEANNAGCAKEAIQEGAASVKSLLHMIDTALQAHEEEQKRRSMMASATPRTPRTLARPPATPSTPV